jgi:hypothetical protein
MLVLYIGSSLFCVVLTYLQIITHLRPLLEKKFNLDMLTWS